MSRLRPVAVDAGLLHGHVDQLRAATTSWNGRGDGARRAADSAVEMIDAAITELRRVRRQLLGQVRRSDKAAANEVKPAAPTRPVAETQPRPASPPAATPRTPVVTAPVPAEQRIPLRKLAPAVPVPREVTGPTPVGAVDQARQQIETAVGKAERDTLTAGPARRRGGRLAAVGRAVARACRWLARVLHFTRTGEPRP